MISMYVGLPGAGKTYSLMRYVIVPALVQGRRVITNLPVNTGSLNLYTERAGRVESIAIDDLRDEARFARIDWRGAVVVLDEIWRVWPKGTRADRIPEFQRSFFAEHRHMVDAGGHSTEVVLCTQDAGQCATFLQELVDTTYRTVNLARFGPRDRYRVDVYAGCKPSSKLSPRQRQREIYGRYDPLIFRLYRSHTKAAGTAVGDERETDSRRSVWRSARVLYLLPLAGVGFAASVWAASSFFSTDELSSRPVSAELARPTPNSSTVSVARPASLLPGPRSSSTPRIAGYVVDARGRGYAMIVSDGRVYRVEYSQCWEEWPDDVRCTWRGQVVME